MRLAVLYFDSYSRDFVSQLCSFSNDSVVACCSNSYDVSEYDCVLLLLPVSRVHDYQNVIINLVKTGKSIFILDHAYDVQTKLFASSHDINGYFWLPIDPSQLYISMIHSFESIYKVSNLIEYKGISLNPGERIVKFGSSYLSLRNLEFRLLHYFLNNRGFVLTKRKILEDVWDRNAVTTTTTLESHISSLRKKLAVHMDNELIKTVYCVGYMVE